MRTLRPIGSLLIALFLTSSLLAQGPFLRLESGKHPVPADLEERLQEGNTPDLNFKGRTHALLTFDETPDRETRKRMEADGIRFLQYLPDRTYIVSYRQDAELAFLKQYSVRSLHSLKAAYRIAERLKGKPYPVHAVKGDKIELQLNFFEDLSFRGVMKSLRKDLSEQEGAQLLRTLPNSKRAEVRIPQEELSDLVKRPYLEFVEPIDPEPKPDDRTGRSLHRSNVINSQIAGGKRYNGDSIVMAIADDGGIGPHIDFKGRMTDHTGGLGGNHGDMTAGIAVGAGNLNPTVQGHASGAHLHMYDINGYPHINNAVSNLSNLGTRITSTSYSQGCNDYDSDAENADDQIYQNPELLHVFSAGNSASDDCGYGASGWGNITGGTKQGKNVIASGNLDDEDNLASSSSRGPAEDGRIKPDLCANGAGQLSTDEGNIYQVGGGTSAASPSIAGVVTQLYDAYKELNGGNFPNSALIKASLLNTAKDLDDHGPDFNTGWGRINASKAFDLIKENRYMKDSIDQSGVNTHNISVPSGVEEVRVMVYWTDPAGSPTAAQTLVNDLNIDLTTPSATSYDPWVLDHSPNSASLDAPATRGRDSVNNVEQVTLANPSAGTHVLTVEGYNVPQGPQTYFLVYEFLGNDVELTYPHGEEGFVPNTTEKLRWDAFGNSGTFDLSYSTDSGNTWNSIVSGLSADQRHYTWTVPNTITGDAFVKVTRGGVSDSNERPFAVVDTANNIDFQWVCQDSAMITWDSAAGAIGHEVYRLGNEYMDSIGISSDTSMVISPFDPSQDQWFSVSAIGPDSMEGRRAYAVKYTGGNPSNCPLDSNLRLTMLSPTSADIPSCQADTIPVKVRVENLGLDSVLGFSVAYNVNGGASFIMPYNDTLAPDSTAVLTFTDSVGISTTSKDIQSWVEHPYDQTPYNDSSQVATVQTISTSSYTPHYGQDMEGLSICEGAHDNCTVVCNLSEGLINQDHPSSDSIDWRVGEGPTPSSNTGPSNDFDPGTSSGNYLYLESSYGCEGKEGVLLTPCVDISNADPVLVYGYHMNGNAMGDLHVDVLVDGVWHLNVRPTISGDQGTTWNADTVDLSSFQGDRMSIRFRGVTGNDYQSDIAIDGIQLIDTSEVPAPDFSGQPRNPCTGDLVSFTDRTVGLVDSLRWSISPSSFTYVNGTDANSTDPEVQFSATGWYEVKLLAYNSAGVDSVVKSQYIKVGAYTSAPIAEDFENSNFPPVPWTVDDAGGNYSWQEIAGITGVDGQTTKAAYVRNYDYDNQGLEDNLVSEVVDLSNTSDPILTFDVAYARYSSNYYDGLKVMVSGDCGSSISVEYDKSGSQLATAPDDQNEFFPSSQGDWRKDTVDLSAYSGSQRLMVRFANVNGYGNNLYVDNINIQSKFASVEEHANSLPALQLYPNPSRDRLFVKGKVRDGGSLRFRIEDMQGRRVRTLERKVDKGSFRTKLDVASLEAGIYLLRTMTPQGREQVAKFVVQR